MLTRFIDPKNDFIFKKLFGSEQNKNILIAFLNDMIDFKEGFPIVDVEFIKNTQDPILLLGKSGTIDVLCKDEKGHIYIVEMQMAKEKCFEKRCQYYASKAYSAQIREGSAYEELKEVIVLAICNFVLFPHKKAFKSNHAVVDLDTHERDLKDFAFTFLELPKFQKNEHELTSSIDRWAYFFKHAHDTSESEIDEIMKGFPLITKAYHKANQSIENIADLLLYEEIENADRIQQARLDQSFEDGMEKGKEEGVREERKKTIESLLKSGFDLETILKIMKISKEDYEDLIK
jgi:predicted transposase/invertase (TIGR01784 family)